MSVDRDRDQRVALLTKVVKLRNAGWTFRQIASEVGVSTERARHLFYDADWRLWAFEHPETVIGAISTHAQNFLRETFGDDSGYLEWTSQELRPHKDELARLVESKYGYGHRVLEELYAFLGEPLPVKDVPVEPPVTVRRMNCGPFRHWASPTGTVCLCGRMKFDAGRWVDAES